jgi:major membrane immunogen (membrane-anchored lipoprotein)
MKKSIAFLICISLFLTGCGASTAETQPETTEATPTTVATEAPTEAATEAPTETVAAEEGTIAETVVYDDGTFKLTAKEIDYSDDYSIKIKVLAENNSDKNVSFTGTQFSVNHLIAKVF